MAQKHLLIQAFIPFMSEKAKAPMGPNMGEIMLLFQLVLDVSLPIETSCAARSGSSIGSMLTKLSRGSVFRGLEDFRGLTVGSPRCCGNFVSDSRRRAILITRRLLHSTLSD